MRGDIEQPKFLNMAVLEYPATALEAILNETKFLFKNATFEIVAHGLNLHRDDIKSDISIKKIIKMSDDDIDWMWTKFTIERLRIFTAK
jgi:phosphate:Na+ symporter